MRSSVVRPIASVRSRGAAVFQEGSARFTVARRQTLRLPSSVLSAHYQPGTLNVLVNHRSGCSYLRPWFLPSCGSFDAKFDRLNRRNLDNLAVHAFFIPFKIYGQEIRGELSRNWFGNISATVERLNWISKKQILVITKIQEEEMEMRISFFFCVYFNQKLQVSSFRSWK